MVELFSMDKRTVKTFRNKANGCLFTRKESGMYTCDYQTSECCKTSVIMYENELLFGDVSSVASGEFEIIDYVD